MQGWRRVWLATALVAGGPALASAQEMKAEVIHWDELLDVGGWTEAKEVGKLRTEGKDYEVQDGDVLEIRFNV